MLRQNLLRLSGGLLLLMGATILGAGVIGLIEWSVNTFDSPLSGSHPGSEAGIGLLLAVAGAIMVLKARKYSHYTFLKISK